MLEEVGWENGGGSPGVEESKRGAFKGRGDPLEWNRVCRNKMYKIKKVGRRLLGKNFSLFREYNLQRLQSKQDEAAAKDGDHE